MLWFRRNRKLKQEQGERRTWAVEADRRAAELDKGTNENLGRAQSLSDRAGRLADESSSIRRANEFVQTYRDLFGGPDPKRR